MQDFPGRLLDWFDEHGRKDLPWQKDINLYRVWVSEIMLQQTQVNTVIPYYERFISRFPTIDQLAEATEDEVLHLWTGLGYYARARNLHKTAGIIMSDYNGTFPESVEELESLPGIGRSTAGAMISICTDERAAILDGNVKRVIARCFAIEGWPGQSKTLKALWSKSEELTPQHRVADYTQAIMDLGAMVCTRTKPDCDQCPFDRDCQARATGSIENYPGRKPKKALPIRSTAMLVIRHQDEVLLEKRPSSGLWGGLWSFPELAAEDIESVLRQRGLKSVEPESLPAFRHTFTHFHLDIQPMLVQLSSMPDHIEEPDRRLWYKISNPPEVGLTQPVVKLLRSLQTRADFQ